ncbi:hypothetical protein K466DRAFT_309385 [Polyporus arcularius HHB13444]|uniref:Uncharacterized protein n=1 Tax=Polyporus arcularius HHB13444 TaxID=1314778 RepID=A0A5C3PQ75_9APHY|nr:hypothetical protein K466DRAFT_309385 [Polyporus arcularius HHB13444]
MLTESVLEGIRSSLLLAVFPRSSAKKQMLRGPSSADCELRHLGGRSTVSSLLLAQDSRDLPVPQLLFLSVQSLHGGHWSEVQEMRSIGEHIAFTVQRRRAHAA